MEIIVKHAFDDAERRKRAHTGRDIPVYRSANSGEDLAIKLTASCYRRNPRCIGHPPIHLEDEVRARMVRARTHNNATPPAEAPHAGPSTGIRLRAAPGDSRFRVSSIALCRIDSIRDTTAHLDHSGLVYTELHRDGRQPIG